MQACLEKQLQDAISRYDVQNGAFGIVMNVKTGEILAMATIGGYDPNQYLEIANPQTQAQLEQLRLEYLAKPEDSEIYQNGKQDYLQALNNARLKQWRNRCISDGYEPGSSNPPTAPTDVPTDPTNTTTEPTQTPTDAPTEPTQAPTDPTQPDITVTEDPKPFPWAIVVIAVVAAAAAAAGILLGRKRK